MDVSGYISVFHTHSYEYYTIMYIIQKKVKLDHITHEQNTLLMSP